MPIALSNGGIDEAFLDASEKVADWAEAEVLARRIKQEIKEKEGLTASIGVGPNKLVAKVASDFHKPIGLIRCQGRSTPPIPEPYHAKVTVGGT